MSSGVAALTHTFLSAGWLAAARSRLTPPPPVTRSTVAFRMRITDRQPGQLAAVDVRVNLTDGLLALDAAAGPEPGLLFTFDTAAATQLLLGTPLARAGIVERGDVEVAGNFSLIFFIDAALQRDHAGHVATLRALTARAPAGASELAGNPNPEPAPDQLAAVEHARTTLPSTMRLLEALITGSTPGAQLFVSRGAELAADVGIGLARPGVPMTNTSKVLWYCCAKPLLSVALGQLWEQGRFDPYRPVADYLPEFGVGGKEQVASWQLLTHTGPIPTGLDPLHGVVAGPDDIRHRLAFDVSPPQAPTSGTGSAINYSQWWSWFVLAELIPAIDGRSYVDYVNAEIIEPCGMTDTLVVLDDADFDEIGDQLPLIHVGNPGSSCWPTYWWSTKAATTRCIPGVNTRGSMADLGRFYRMLLAGGRVAEHQLVSPTTVVALTARHRYGKHDRWGNSDWGLGFRLECRQQGEEFTSFGSYTSGRSYGHDGLWTAVAFADPEQELAVAIHLNGKIEHEPHRVRILGLADAIYTDLS